MKYFVISDIHGNFAAFTRALREAGFDKNNIGHKIIFLGDAFDHGKTPSGYVDVYVYLKELVESEKLIYILGNHETELLTAIEKCKFGGNRDTAVALANYFDGNITEESSDAEISKALVDGGLVGFLEEYGRDYFELEKYVFVHGFIPVIKGIYCDEWRSLPREKWGGARRKNGVAAVIRDGIRVPNKTVVCGHVGAYYGHIRERYPEVEYGSPEFKKIAAKMCKDKNPEDYKIFYGDGVIGIDGNAHKTNMVNCLTVEI